MLVLSGLLLVSACLGGLTAGDEDVDSSELSCFQEPSDACPEESSSCRCRQLPGNSSAVVCCNIESEFFLAEGLACANVGATDEVKSLHIRNATLDQLDVSSASFRRLKSMSVTNGRIKKVVGEFAKHASILCFNISGNLINTIEPRAFVNLVKLETLDLSYNNLSAIPNFRKKPNDTAAKNTTDANKKVNINIIGNKSLMCKSLLEALRDSELKFQNANETFCLSPTSYHWFNTTESVPFIQIESYDKIQKECISECSCEAYRLVILPDRTPTYTVNVDCSAKQLTDLPERLPPNTFVLNISHNKITSLAPMTESSYSTVKELYADNNQIESILPLEGSKFLDNFVVLSLRENKIRSLPMYMFSNIFDQNSLNRYISLSKNHLYCDCSTAKDLKKWLLNNRKYFVDLEGLLCYNQTQKVMDLDPSIMCQSLHDWTDYIYYIIAGEVFLLLFLICKVTYDYWVFKTTGYLPWPASKMPKLPCDWLCET